MPEREGRSGALDGANAGGGPQPWDASNLSDTVTLDELRDVPVVVVLGERGAGKSVALEQEHHLLERDGAATSLLHLGQQVSDATSAGDDLAELLDAGGDSVRHLLLDGLDEGMDAIAGLDKTLSRQLRRMDPEMRRRLRLRITFRSTRWSGQLEDGLLALWPDPGQVALLTLAPLTPQDVLDAAGQHGLDAAAFATQVTGRSLEPLSQQPVTLIPLLTAREQGKELPGTVAEAFNQACRMLCTENWEQGFARRQDRPTVDDLLEVARWTAAALQLVAVLADRHGTVLRTARRSAGPRSSFLRHPTTRRVSPPAPRKPCVRRATRHRRCPRPRPLRPMNRRSTITPPRLSPLTTSSCSSPPLPRVGIVHRPGTTTFAARLVLLSRLRRSDPQSHANLGHEGYADRRCRTDSGSLRRPVSSDCTSRPWWAALVGAT